MSLGFDNTTAEVNDFKYITVTSKEDAIQENIYFEDFKVEKWEGKDDAYLEVTVRNDKGQTANRRYTEPKIDGTIIKDEAGLKKATDKFLKISKNIATKVLGENAAVKGNNWFELWTNLVNSIKAKPGWNKVPMRAVFVHDNNGYTKLRTFSPIFELMSVSKENSQLKVGDYDKFVARVNPSTENDGLSISNAATTENDVF